MKKKSISQSGLFSVRGLFAVFLCAAAACSLLGGAPISFFHSKGGDSPRTLTFAERAAYQHAIEDVYWRHRIWPKERSDAKPSLDAVMLRQQIEQKVTDYLRKSQALEDYWQRPITAEQLQAEMDRMAKQSRQPEVLQELFAALGNDPFVIAECLARPALADRLLTSWYAYDQTIHGDLKQRAEAELRVSATVEELKHTSGNFTETDYFERDSGEAAPVQRLSKESAAVASALQRQNSTHSITLNHREWDDGLRKLASKFNRASNQLVIGKPSSLQEADDRYYATAVMSKTNDHLKLATVSWPKEPLESWLARAKDQSRAAIAAPAPSYTLPSISDGAACVDDTWRITAGAPDARSFHSAVWTGSEMIVWGGDGGAEVLNTGGRYNPSTDTWTTTALANAPSRRELHTAIWSGTEMIVWGGYLFDGGDLWLNTGGRYNPLTDTWTATSLSNAPSARSDHTALWTGNEMIVWGGSANGSLDTGGRYNPDTNSWIATSTLNSPTGRELHTAVWTGNEMIVWGGYSSVVGDDVNTGGRYNPNTDSWTATSATNVPTARQWHTAVWTGSEMIVWGGQDTLNSFNTGGRYNPTTNSWTATTTENAPSARSGHTAVWTGDEMMVWGSDLSNTGGRYNPETNIWTSTSSINAPAGRDWHTAVWTGNEMIVWGGTDSISALNTGGRYNPITNSWVATGPANAPRGRYRHTGVWTGSEMIVWGGRTRGFSYLNNGGSYDPTTDSWTATSIANAPSARVWHTGVWTGTEMIIWGGLTQSGDTNTGGRYNPTSNSWAPTTTLGAPTARDTHTAVWTGSEMVVWGGYFFDADQYLDTGGRYNLTSDSWTATTTTNAPGARTSHTAVWTGSEMVVWGGYFFDGTDHWFDTGARYEPGNDSWTPTSSNSAPTARAFHKAVWTGNEMIVWGGSGSAGYVNTGGRYDPNTNGWTAISSNNAPSGRAGHTAIWTGVEMIVWAGYDGVEYVNTGGRYNLNMNSWTHTSMDTELVGRTNHTAIWTGNEMIVWGGLLFVNVGSNTGGRYCAQSGPPPTPTPTATASPTATPTSTVTATITPSGTPTATPTVTITPSSTPRVTPTPRPRLGPRIRPTPPPHTTPLPPPSSPRPTMWPRPTPPPHTTPIPPPSSPRPTPFPRP